MAKAPSALPRYKRIEKQIRDASNACHSAIEEIDAILPAAKREADRQTLQAARNAVFQSRAVLNEAMGKLFDQIQ